MEMLLQVAGCCLGVVGSEIGFWAGSPLDDCAEDTPFGSCRRPCYVDVQGAADGRVQMVDLDPRARGALWLMAELQ